MSKGRENKNCQNHGKSTVLGYSLHQKAWYVHIASTQYVNFKAEFVKGYKPARIKSVKKHETREVHTRTTEV